MTKRMCWSCGTTFYSDFFVGRCNVCQQGEALAKQSAKQAQQAISQAEDLQRRNAAAAEHNARIIAAAEEQRAAAIRQQTKIIAESAITLDEAYNEGYNYITDDFVHGNSSNLKITATEYGVLSWTWNSPYVTDRLQKQFRKGLADRLNRIEGTGVPAKEAMLDSAKRAGTQNAEGTLSSYFVLNTDIYVNGVEVKSAPVQSNFTSTLNEETGELVMRWNHPFTDDELNQAYLDGVNEVHWRVNTEEQKLHRLNTDVVHIKNERKKSKNLKRYNKLYGILTVVIPLFFVYVCWFITTGLYTLLSFGAAWGLWKWLKNKHHDWQMNNHHYLYRM